MSVGGLCNLDVHILHAKASLREGSISNLQGGLMVMAHDYCFYLSPGCTSYHTKFSVFGFILVSGVGHGKTGIVTVTFLPFSFSCILFGRGR